jgi:hypothetical protein
MKTLLLFCSLLLLAPSAFSQTATPQPPEPLASCPVQVDEAWLSASGSTIPADTAAKEWKLHVSLTNKSEKAITSFVVHADITLHPDGSLANPATSEQRRHKWTGELAPAAHLNEEWKLAVGPHAAGLNRTWLDRINFADGSRWSGDGSVACSFPATGHMVPTKSGDPLP